MKNSWVTKVGLFAGLLFLLAGPAGAQDLKIGVIQPLSGPMALLGKYSLEGSEVARLELNGKGGLLGKKVEFIIVDAPDATTDRDNDVSLIGWPSPSASVQCPGIRSTNATRHYS